MNKYYVHQYLSNYKYYLFPNKQHTKKEIESVLLSAPDGFVQNINEVRFSDPSLASVLALVPFGWDRPLFAIARVVMLYLSLMAKPVVLYLSELFGISINNISNVQNEFAELMLIFALGWWIYDIVTSGRRCRRRNCDRLLKNVIIPSFDKKV